MLNNKCEMSTKRYSMTLNGLKTNRVSNKMELCLLSFSVFLWTLVDMYFVPLVSLE